MGVGHWPGTALPSQTGNVVVAGHRVTHSRPFRNLDTLGPGDQVIFTIGSGQHTYTFAGNEIVPPNAMRIVNQSADKTATLFACHPPGSARFRFVVPDLRRLDWSDDRETPIRRRLRRPAACRGA